MHPLKKLISPKYCSRFITCYQKYISLACLLFLSYGLFAGLVLAPKDYQQGNVYRIMYIHVPLAIGSMGIYGVMSVAAITYLIWKIKIADYIAKISAPIGAVFTALTLITGSIWGRPTWGTWWIWDARLTSEFILLFIYLGIIAIRSSIPEPRLSAHASSIVILLGFINIPIVHYSVNWWNTLHQGASILKWGAPSIAASMLYPLLSMIMAAFLYYILLVMIRLKYELDR
ncbi:MAG: hypothetical protein A3F13_04650 [Gammaproteobacteria bacterium RIFCSPHIGHO2_12_FULL_40_19]|nr:MAG: hypothetical protein A3F13_04650 [Gammaproteobacteria bacterium RIFCSPHIGHO2_12_FULL_40_19]